MGVYDLYRKQVGSTLTDKQLIECDMTQQIKDNFTKQPNYHQVYRNLETATPYDVLITTGNIKDNSVGYKNLISYPYDTYIFDNGDYIHMTYGGESTTWLLTSLDKPSLYEVKGRIERCNNDLKWIDNYGEVKSYKCVISDVLKEDRFKDSKNITLPDGFISVEVQGNAFTDTLNINKRFLFNGQAWKLRSIMDLVDKNTRTFIMVKDTVNEATDDLINNIADAYEYDYELVINQDDFEQAIGYSSTLSSTLTLNGEVSTEAIEWLSSNITKATINSSTGLINLLGLGSVNFTARMVDNISVNDSITVSITATPSGISENIISPNIANVLKDETQIYTVYNYVDNVQSADTFTFVPSGALSRYYTLTSINGNSFSVKSLGYTSTKLTITCTNNTDSSTVTKEISLKGLW